jgi:hypothetical protein
MKIFNSIKKIFEKKEEITKIKKEEILFFDIPDWINKKKAKKEEEEEKILEIITEKINIFINQLEEKITIAENVDVDAIRDNPHYKIFTKEGRTKYIESLRYLTKKINKIEKENLYLFTRELDKTFTEFNKSSYKNYERATILIGKEMLDIKNTITSFSKELVAIIDNNKSLLDSLEKIYKLEADFKELQIKEEDISSIENALIISNKKLEKNNELNNELNKKIKEIKESETYKNNLDKIKKLEQLKNELETEILEIKHSLDFKELGNTYHTIPKKMEIIQRYKNNFSEEFKKNNKEILELLNENDKKLILKKIEKVDSKKDQIEKYRQEIKADETKKIIDLIEKLKQEDDSLSKEIAKLENIKEKLTRTKNEIKEKIKKDFEDMTIAYD